MLCDGFNFTNDMTIGELKKIIDSIPNEFIFEVEVEKKVSQEELSKRSYPYPFDSERCQIKCRDYDIGWMEKKMKVNVRLNEL